MLAFVIWLFRYALIASLTLQSGIVLFVVHRGSSERLGLSPRRISIIRHAGRTWAAIAGRRAWIAGEACEGLRVNSICRGVEGIGGSPYRCWELLLQKSKEIIVRQSGKVPARSQLFQLKFQAYCMDQIVYIRLVKVNLNAFVLITVPKFEDEVARLQA